jgi:hypothetical protein
MFSRLSPSRTANFFVVVAKVRTALVTREVTFLASSTFHSSEFSVDGNDPAGSSHCAQLDSRRYAQDVGRHMLNFCAAARAMRC